ncbi:MAG: hypothetical protein RLZZ543_2084 [Bacteroidota bacterium]
MKIKFVFILLIINTPLFAQDGELNYRYWQMRQRFVDQYVKIGDCHGCSLPVSRITTPDSWGTDRVIFDDESVRILGWYISVLATENHLLRINSQTTQTNNEELYYALKTIDRLDKYGEFINYNVKINNDNDPNLIWDGEHYNAIVPEFALYTDLESNLNGFFIREDVPPDLFEYFGKTSQSSRGIDVNASNYSNKTTITSKASEMSQDELFHLMIGLAFTSKYVDEFQVFNGVYLRDYARQICDRLINHYSDFWILNNPVLDQQVRNYKADGSSSYTTGNSMFFSYLVSTAASVISGIDLPESSLGQWGYDLLNPYANFSSMANRELWVSVASSFFELETPHNLAMIYTLMAISGVPRSLESNAKDFLHHDYDFKTDGHRFFGNIYRALHDNDENVGFSLNELHERLSLLTCQGPYYYCQFNQSLPYCNLKLTFQSNWSFDNSFLDDEPHDQVNFNGSSYNGHFNATDWMLAYNIYLILSDTESEFVSGIDRELNDIWPQVNPLNLIQTNSGQSANVFDIFESDIPNGSIFNPKYRFGKNIHSTEKFLVNTYDVHIQDQNGIVYDELQDFGGDGKYTAKELISLDPGFEVAIGAQFSAEIGEESCLLATDHRIRNPNNSEPIGPKFKAVNHHLDDYYKKTLPVPIRQFGNEGIQVFPNPSISGFNLKINANSNSVITLNLLDLNGKSIQEFGEITLQTGINQPYFQYDNIPAGVYQLSIIGDKINSVLRLVKM